MSTATSVQSVRFRSIDGECAALRYTAGSADLTGPAGRPIVVMAHGFGGTVRSGLEGFAERFAAIGCDVLAFDYRGFGESSGAVRRYVSVPGQVQDYLSAVVFARGIDGVDPARVVIWGTSLSAGHTFDVAGRDTRLAAAIAMTPAVDGLSVAWGTFKHHGVRPILALVRAGLRDEYARVRGLPPVEIEIAGTPPTPGMLIAPGAGDAYRRIAGPDWVNATPARIGLRMHTLRVTRKASAVRCPMLVQIGDQDLTAPPEVARKAAFNARADVRSYPCDHFDVYPGQPWFDQVVSHQELFLRQKLTP